MDYKKAAYNWDVTLAIGDIAMSMAQNFLLSKTAARDWLAISEIETLEDHEASRKLGIDLLCKLKAGTTPLVKVEVKGDRNEKTGNLFFETKSNRDLNTPGCFMSSEADWMVYCFVNIGSIYVIPLKAARAWFLKNMNSFREVTTKSHRKTENENSTWYTVGRLVPRQRLVNEIAEVKLFRLMNKEWLVDK